MFDMLNVEQYVKNIMIDVKAHDVKHTLRVRDWALKIAKSENYKDLQMVEVAALLHDIGHVGAKVKKNKIRHDHGEVGAVMAEKFLTENKMFSVEKVGEICKAIRFHNKNREGSSELLDIIRDADMMDLFGFIGVMRAIIFVSEKEDYDRENIKSSTWGYRAEDFDKLFDSGVGKGRYIVDNINFHISCYDNLKTNFAKMRARPLVLGMKKYLLNLEEEIKNIN